MSTAHSIQIDWGIPELEIPTEQQLRAWVDHALEPGTEASVDIRIVDPEEIQGLNRDYREQDKPTNVLSFPADVHPAVGLNHLGDLVVCAEVVQVEAEEQGKPALHHWAHMMIHGILHLRGFDHIEERDAALMEAEERRLLEQLDIPDPYLPR